MWEGKAGARCYWQSSGRRIWLYQPWVEWFGRAGGLKGAIMESNNLTKQWGNAGMWERYTAGRAGMRG